MSLRERLTADLAASAKARGARRVSTLRLLLAAVHNEEIAKKVAALTDADVLTVIEREAKRRREAAAAYADAGRSEAAAAERAEEEILRAYLPPPLSDAEIQEVITAVLAEQVGSPHVGTVMGLVMSRLKGRGADGDRVRTLVSRMLSP